MVKACCFIQTLPEAKKSVVHEYQVEEEDQGGYQCQAATSSGGWRQVHYTSMKLRVTVIKIGTMLTWPGARGM